MLKFIRGKSSSHVSSERAKVQRDLYVYRKMTTHGFPSKPSALAYDPTLKLIAIGNKTGSLRVLGRPGVEFSGQHQNEDSPIIKIIFAPKQGGIITLTDDNSLHLWQFRNGSGASLQLVKSYPLDGKLKKISCLRLKQTQDELYVGTEGGNVYTLNISKFEMTENVIYLDVVLQNAPETYKCNPGAVESVLEMQEHVIIGYERGLITKWSPKLNKSVKHHIQNQQLEYLSIKSDNEVVSSHNDGSYIVWDFDKETNQTRTVYGPFPCKKISKITMVGDYTIFNGGLPRASYGDHHSVSVLTANKHIVFDFTSKIIDFEVIDDEALIVLAEEELVAIDLKDDDWPVFKNPYLNAVHPSAVTCFQYCPLTKDIDVRGGEDGSKFSKNTWPVTGGECVDSDHEQRELLITGHEDGSVRFWDTSGPRMTLLGKFSFSSLFRDGDDLDPIESLQEDEEDEWPPFRKAGTFDPYSDDPRLAVKKLAYCTKTGYLTVGGTAGQLMVVNTKSVASTESIKADTVNLVSENFVWKGHEPLQYNKVVGVTALLQIQPPAAVTAMALEGSSGLVAVGTGHGFVLYDYISRRVLMSKSTLNPSDVMASGDVGMSRRKSFKKSLRESFRRLRKGRSQRQPDNARSPSSAAVTANQIQKPVERAIEARDEAMSSMVRSLSFSRTYLLSLQSTTPTLWAGTNAGTVYVCVVSEAGEARAESSCVIAKEIQLKHRAPVLSIIVLDGHSSAIENFSSENHPGPHRVLIGSEEQIKIFTLPNLRPFGKLKLTAQEGSRLRKMSVAVFNSVSESYSEKCLCCLTNHGDLYVITLPDLKRQISTKCLRKEDISGISSLVFTTYGQALYMCSSSELQRITLSANYHLPQCFLPGLEYDNTNSIGRNDYSMKVESLDVSGDITIDVVTDHIDIASPVPNVESLANGLDHNEDSTKSDNTTNANAEEQQHNNTNDIIANAAATTVTTLNNTTTGAAIISATNSSATTTATTTISASTHTNSITTNEVENAPRESSI